MREVDFDQIEKQMTRSKKTSQSKQKDPISAKVMGFMMRNKNGIKVAILAVILVIFGLIQTVKYFISFPITCWSILSFFLIYNFFPNQTEFILKKIWFPFGWILGKILLAWLACLYFKNRKNARRKREK